ncbi:MAG: nuclear transport factor 2 family protein [Bacteroidota bacterium]
MQVSNKKKVSAFIKAINARDSGTVAELVHPDYVQHNPFLPTGRAAFVGLFPILQENNTQALTKRIFQNGNWVVMHNKWEGASPFGAETMVSFDVLRLDENGLIAEHWDAMMPFAEPNPSGRTLIDGSTEITDLDKTAEHKAKVVKLFDTLINGSQEEAGQAVAENFHPDYLQHNPMTADGIAGFSAAVPTEQWVFTKQHKVIGEGNFVLSISEGTHKGVHAVFYDLLRFEDGKIAEHWDVIQPIPTENLANENTMFNF